ncbi:MAG TPA: dioxygenase [Flavobacteriales bacterium]|nr:dioxygenase [Flavobacteriales bacterium]
MNRRNFLISIFGIMSASKLYSLKNFTDELPAQSKLMPVIFTSHGNPFDIIKSREERSFWKVLNNLGQSIKSNYDITAAVIISAHWCTKGTYVNTALNQKQIYDYYGFPEEYYKVKYVAKGKPDLAREIANKNKLINPTTDWGLDHGAWPVLMHMFPEGDIPVFEISLNYYASPQYHYNLAKELQQLRKKGVLVIGSGALIHNLKLAMQKLTKNDTSPYGWEAEYSEWLIKQLNSRNTKAFLNYETSHKLGKLASPTPDHFFPVLYTLGLMNKNDDIDIFYNEQNTHLPAFSETSFILS